MDLGGYHWLDESPMLLAPLLLDDIDRVLDLELLMMIESSVIDNISLMLLFGVFDTLTPSFYPKSTC